jgi:molecular chaperone GrpE (heat shock protein)
VSDARPGVDVTAAQGRAADEPPGAEVPADAAQDGDAPSAAARANAAGESRGGDVQAAATGRDVPSGPENGDPTAGTQGDDVRADAEGDHVRDSVREADSGEPPAAEAPADDPATGKPSAAGVPAAEPSAGEPSAGEPSAEEPGDKERPADKSDSEDPTAAGSPADEPSAREAAAAELLEVLAGLTALGARVDDVARAAAELSRLRSRDTDLIARLHDDLTRLRTGEIAAALNPVVTGMIKLHDQMVSLGALNDPASPVGMLHTQLLQILELTCAVRPFTPSAGERFDASHHTGIRRIPTTQASADGTIASTVKAGFVRADGSVVRVAEVEVHRLSG